VKINILINALGVSDSGGLSVLKKLLHECAENTSYYFLIYCNENLGVRALSRQFDTFSNCEFKIVENRGVLNRLFFENVKFKKIISINKINLIYNFTGTFQPFLDIPQVVKVHNLIFYSKKLDNFYRDRGDYYLWMKHIFSKRILFKFMHYRAKNIEIQSAHVKNCLSQFFDVKKKSFYVKSDICIFGNEFLSPKEYDFTKKVRFLYVVGPHFHYQHKNMLDFTNAMLGLLRVGIDFEIHVTLTASELADSKVWDIRLNHVTVFHGYIDTKKAMDDMFSDNTILISTSVIETLGLHVIEGIKNGVISITPNENYADQVYGLKRITYSLFSPDSLIEVILKTINSDNCFSTQILIQQDYLVHTEKRKIQGVTAIFEDVLKVYK